MDRYYPRGLGKLSCFQRKKSKKGANLQYNIPHIEINNNNGLG